MKLVRIELGQSTHWGILEEDTVYSIEGNVYGDFLKGARLCALGETKLLAPAEPSIIVCCGRNYPRAIQRSGRPVPQEPVLFFKPPVALCNPDEDTLTLPISNDTRFEPELCAVMKCSAWQVTEEEALRYVLGYTCGNDMTLYDLVRADERTTRGKGYYKSAPLGPWLVTDLDPRAVRIRGIVNGVTIQDGNTAEQFFGAARIISHISQFMPLRAGDVVYTGTPEGGRTISAGDLLKVEVEGIGTLSNRVVVG